jgi:hypothetical protein
MRGRPQVGRREESRVGEWRDERVEVGMRVESRVRRGEG